MASPREIKKRISSVKNTRKITRTMEMVSTAKSKKASDRVNASQPYANKVQELMSSLASLAKVVESPFLRKPEKVRKVAIFAITANRGLCGGYNGNINRKTLARLREWKEKGAEVELHMVGKKGINYFRYLKIPVEGSYTNIDDKAGYKEAQEFATLFMNKFAKEEIDVVEIISTVYKSSANQVPELTPVLPIQPPETSSSEPTVNETVIYEPNPQTILENLLPMVVKIAFQRAILEAVCSEHIARRIAMKSATDAAGDMIKALTRGYNRVRQAKITQEISEIVGGASSIN
ncbi:ATP synthase F1 subunit gamma [Leptospira sp. GIMC2001]|uniref:ATP synthase F1 subunit gamma n=1 Tax=Leptospira sp. GIMC2001 TaxID=1513297 RepID=UPI00234970A2|nr:ATP synthase F1 subunit gamma [Leptospira sp. GIMC2001]WCL48925.1 ATP synthase F1 subunit gamma [Leptospira sp. GIMC2001]